MNPEDAIGLLAGGGAFLIGILSLIGLVVPIVCYWKIIGKTGHPAPLALLFLFPLAGLILMYWLAFSEWPAIRRGAATAAGPPMPVPPVPPAYPAPVPSAPAMPPAPQAGGGTAPVFKFCTGCGVGLEGIERFCANCGKPVNPS